MVQLVGVLNITPDSFSDGGDYLDAGEALARAESLFVEGASIVDVGGEATNPWAIPIDSDEEWRRVKIVLRALLSKYSGRISIDTQHPEIIERAARYGDFIVNDVTGFANPAMIDVTAKHGLRAIISHLPFAANGDVHVAHKQIKMDDINQVHDELLVQRSKLLGSGIKADNIILDPGIGFGKTMKLNWQLLEFAKLVPGQKVMIGHSRKRFLATDPKTGEDIPGADKYTAELNLVAAKTAIHSGAAYLRVHDISVYSDLL